MIAVKYLPEASVKTLLHSVESPLPLNRVGSLATPLAQLQRMVIRALWSGYPFHVSHALTALYRPVGQAELDLIRASGFRRFPPRLPEQPFFYPVLNEEYAKQIARDWNTNDEASGFVGYVLRFQVRSNFLANYEKHQVGGAHHREYWIPAAELEQFNDNIVGLIEVLSAFRKGQETFKQDP